MVSIMNGLLPPEVVTFGPHAAFCSHLRGAQHKACPGACCRWVSCPHSIALGAYSRSLIWKEPMTHH